MIFSLSLQPSFKNRLSVAIDIDFKIGISFSILTLETFPIFLSEHGVCLQLQRRFEMIKSAVWGLIQTKSCKIESFSSLELCASENCEKLQNWRSVKLQWPTSEWVSELVNGGGGVGKIQFVAYKFINFIWRLGRAKSLKFVTWISICIHSIFNERERIKCIQITSELHAILNIRWFSWYVESIFCAALELIAEFWALLLFHGLMIHRHAPRFISASVTPLFDKHCWQTRTTSQQNTSW